METICGKSCEACAWKEPLNCSGCREDMGRPFSGPCDIAACCREKGHQRCETCAYLSGCPRRARRDDIPWQELQRREDEAASQRLLAETAPLMAKWVPLIFWLAVPLVLASLLAALAIVAASALFSWFIGMSSRYALVYGSLASLIILLVWLYLCGNILLLGAVIGRVLEDRMKR